MIDQRVFEAFTAALTKEAGAKRVLRLWKSLQKDGIGARGMNLAARTGDEKAQAFQRAVGKTMRRTERFPGGADAYDSHVGLSFDPARPNASFSSMFSRSARGANRK